MSRKDRVLGDVLDRYDRLMESSTSFDSYNRDHTMTSAKNNRHSSARRPRKPSPSGTSTSSTAGFESKGARKARAWGSMVRNVSNNIRQKLLEFWGDQPMILGILDSGTKWRSIMEDLETNSAARDDFLMLLQMMEDRHAQISSSSLKKIATEVGAHHVRRMLQASGPLGGIPDGGQMSIDLALGSRGPPVAPPVPPPPMGGGGVFGPPEMGLYIFD